MVFRELYYGVFVGCFCSSTDEDVTALVQALSSMQSTLAAMGRPKGPRGKVLVLQKELVYGSQGRLRPTYGRTLECSVKWWIGRGRQNSQKIIDQ
jgi:hypothetical protein